MIPGVVLEKPEASNQHDSSSYAELNSPRLKREYALRYDSTIFVGSLNGMNQSSKLQMVMGSLMSKPESAKKVIL